MNGSRSVANVIALVLVPGLLLGQTVHGLVTDQASKLPVAGAIIQLVDSGGRAVSRALTSERGEFWVSAAAAGAYRVRALRIGFRPQTSDAVRLGIGEMIELPFSIASLPVSLDTVRVAGRNSCSVSGDTVVATYAIWEQVRAALTAAQLTAASSELSASTMSYERVMDPTFRGVRKQSTSFAQSFSGRVWRSMSADSLRRFGYVVDDLSGGRIFFAPDLDVLLSPEFIEDHCLRLARGTSESLIGIEFEPNKERSTLGEIAGTVWVDRSSAELRSMDFRYANLSAVESDARPGGQMEFLRLKSGAWAISRWNIRMPVVTRAMERAGIGAAIRSQARVDEIRVAGGELVSVLKGDDTTWARLPVSFEGSVIDSASRERVSGARVTLTGTALSAVTDKDGNFKVVGALPGEYGVEIRTPSLDSIWAAQSLTVSVADGAARTRINVPSADDHALRFCPSAADSSNATAFLVGTVRVEGDTAAPWNTTVSVQWTTGKESASATARTDSYGRFRMCGVPRGRDLAIRTDLDDTSAAPVVRRVPARKRFLVADIVIPKAVAIAGGVFAGTVVTEWSRQPIPDAEVSIADLKVSVRTNAHGRFRITGVSPGPHKVSARKVGYAANDAAVVFDGNRTVTRQFLLGGVATLDPVTATARPVLPEFEENRKLGLGHFLTRADLAKVEDRGFLSGTLADLPGTDIVSSYGNRAYLRTSRIPRDAPDVGGNKDNTVCIALRKCWCWSQVYLDGVLLNPGRPTEPVDVNTLFHLRAQDLEAVEYYASTATLPMKYARRGATCGVYVFHMRRSPIEKREP
jgi:hypothetical protein